MPRKTRQASPTGIYHWISRGYLKKDIFRFKDNFDKFLDLVKEYQPAHSITIYHYCLMNNHVHMLVQAPDTEALSAFSHFIKRRYAYYYSKSYLHAGPTFEKRFIAIPVKEESHLLECGRYIERNPLRAGLVLHPKDYPHSSHAWYLGLVQSDILSASPAFLGLAAERESRIRQYEGYVMAVRPEEEYAKPILAL